MFALLARGRSDAQFDPVRRSYALRGSVVPLLLVLGVFLVKYVVGVDLAMAPRLMQDSQYALAVAGLYGAFTGIFLGRAFRLWRLAFWRAAPAVPA
jgi:cytochrome c biogenesis protein CcdA